jgi:hypothetical protein
VRVGVQVLQRRRQRAPVAEAGHRVRRRLLGEPAQQPVLLVAADDLAAQRRRHERQGERELRGR